MPNITTCTECGCLYEAGSEEQANERERWCDSCRWRFRPKEAPDVEDGGEIEPYQYGSMKAPPYNF